MTFLFRMGVNESDNCKLLLFGYHHDKEYGRKKVTTHVVRLKLFRLKAEGGTHASPLATQGKEKYDCRTLAECDS